MVKQFVVMCPKCRKEFPCHFQELRHKPIKLLCPFCHHEFHQEESPSIKE